LTKRVAVIGAGPIGVEAAVAALRRRLAVTVYERDAIGASVARWGHVRMFSPWALNRSPWGVATLRAAAVPLADDDICPTGTEYVERYLGPLAQWVAPALREHTRVSGVARAHALKGEHTGRPRERAAGPFVLHVAHRGEERYEEADVVLDASGAAGAPNALGPGGLPALGEASVAPLVTHDIPDVLGRDRALYAARRVLVVGSGLSAATSLGLLHALAADEPTTHLHWALREDTPPFARIPDDPLPARDALARFANDASTGGVAGITVHAGAQCLRLAPAATGGVAVMLRHGERATTLHVDRIVANVGHRPDVALSRELQIHLCYASEGPMKLAAALLARAGEGQNDCLKQSLGGIDELRSPEPDYYFLGARSYGRSSQFLLKVGFEQIAAVLDTLG
jgi:thioredoxin reductase